MNLLYTGPSTADLHENYSKKGRLDENAQVRSASTVVIDAPAATIWHLLTDMRNWPNWRTDAEVLELGEIRVDAPFVWKLHSSKIKAVFATVTPERELAWTGVSMGIMKAIDRLLLVPESANRTRVTMEESLAGPLLPLFFTSEKLRAGHDAMLAMLKTAAESSTLAMEVDRSVVA
ncbi:SRPBCC domain-containing protein [Nocardia sp. SYP-A9097]|uniref:SRPBCC domain-containing protein n=1 Tax=Nocardia sp. SYP-A9097 TaxID=2663237 RepID=UPI00129B8C10|nr:SRPBCC domain-containing protein [Nocardia sp. SYP-A9097]